MSDSRANEGSCAEVRCRLRAESDRVAKMQAAPSLMRRWSLALVRHASRGLLQQGGDWATLLERELAEIERDHEALVWAIGCVWAADVERFMCKPRTVSMAAFLCAGLYVSAHYLLIHLAWYG